LDAGQRLGRHLSPGDWLALLGELGAGKTVFVQGLGAALGCRDKVRSPTFVLCQTYAAKTGGRKVSMNHADLYRVEGAQAVGLDWESLTSDGAITVVEWAEKARAFWPAEGVAVRLSHMGGDARRLEFFALGKRGRVLVDKIKERA